jgi:hypothetical protein
MVRMKLTKDEFDVDELDIEYEGPQFERYTGEIPKNNTILTFRVTKAWWLLNDDNESQMKLLMIAEGNDGQLKEYNGLPIWETLTWTPKNARRYQPFLMNFGLTVKDVMNKMDVEAEDDNIGTPINSIARWEPGSDDALCQIVVKRDYWNEEWRAKVQWDGWLEFDPDLYVEPGDDEEDEEPARPTRGRTRSAKSAASSKRGAATTSRRRPEPESDEDDEDLEDYDDIEDDEEDEDIEEEPARPARSSHASSRAAAPSRPATRRGGGAGRSAKAAKPSRSTGRSRSRSADEPPF